MKILSNIVLTFLVLFAAFIIWRVVAMVGAMAAGGPGDTYLLGILVASWYYGFPAFIFLYFCKRFYSSYIKTWLDK